MYHYRNLLLCLIGWAAAASLAAAERTLVSDTFDAPELNPAVWLTNTFTVQDGRLHSGPQGGFVEGKIAIGSVPESTYTIRIDGVRTGQTGFPDHWWGIAPGASDYARGMMFRWNERTLEHYDWWPSQNRSAIGYFPHLLTPGESYDFRIVWTPGRAVQYGYRKSGDSEFADLGTRLESAVEAQRIVLQSPPEVSFDAITVTEEYDPAPATPPAPAELPATLRKLLEVKAGFHLNGFPIGFWNYVELDQFPDRIDENQVRDWAEAGFNLPLGPETQAMNPEHPAKVRQILAWCEKYGIKLLVSDRRAKVGREPSTGMPPEDYRERLSEVYRDYQDSPAFFGFFVHDEPQPDFLAATTESVRIHRELAPGKHPFVNFQAVWPEYNYRFFGFDSPADFLIDYARQSNSDYLVFDNYTQMWPGKYGEHVLYGDTGLDKYMLNLLQYRKASLTVGIPFWVTPLCAAHMNYEVPELTDLKWQFNIALVSGAGGVMWYFYYARIFEANTRMAPVNVHWEKTPTYYALREVHMDFRSRYGDLFNRLVSTKVGFIGRVFGGGKAFVPDGIFSRIEANKLESAPNPDLLVGEFADADARRYGMIVNLDRERSVRLDVTCPGKRVRVFGWNVPDAQRSELTGKRDASGLTLEVWLAPGQEWLVEVDSPEARAVPAEY